MDSKSRVDRHFVYRANACAAAGRFTRVFDSQSVYELPVRSSVSLPVTGGTAMNVDAGYQQVDGALNLVLTGALTCKAGTQSDDQAGTTRTTVSAEVSDLKVYGGLQIPYLKASLESGSTPRDTFAAIRTADCVLEQIRLGDRVLKVDLDLDIFHRNDTFDAATAQCSNRKDFVRSGKGVIVANIVKSVTLVGEPDKRINIVQPNKIHWDNFGWIILGEFLISAQYRRLTMVRLELGSPVMGSAAVGEVETNGHTVP